MLGIVFVPGIMGSRLALNGNEIWPPTVREALLGYRRINALADPHAAPTGVIERVSCKPVYERILGDLSFISSGRAGVVRGLFAPFHYDWRKDLREAAAALADHLDDLLGNGASEIRIVAHSMGGLVTRCYLECGDYDHRPGWTAVKGLLTAATPHRGAPVALGRALGLEATVGLSGADTQRLSAEPAFPSLYQLLPDEGVVSAWSWTGRDKTAADIYDPTLSASLQLSTPNLQAARALREILERGGRPKHVAYQSVAATGHRTVSRVDVRGGRSRDLVRDDDTGDGAVPVWSAALLDAPHQFAPGEHNGVLNGRRFREHLYEWFGAALPADAYADTAEGRGLMSVSIDQLTYSPGGEMDVLLLPARPSNRIDVQLTLTRVEEKTRVLQPAIGRLEWEGSEAHVLRVALDAPLNVGIYSLAVDGNSHVSLDDNDQAVFVVRDA